MKSRSFRRGIVIPLTALLFLAGTVPAKAADKPRLRLISGADKVTLYNYGGEVWFDLGIYVTAERAPLTLKVKRESYDGKIRAWRVLEDGATKRLPGGSVLTIGEGLDRFFKIKVENRKGKTIHRAYASFCPNTWDMVRVSPEASDTSRYPYDCGYSPLALGSIWGIEEGWGTAAQFAGAPLDVGTYKIKVSITERYEDFFDLEDEDVTIRATVKLGEDGPWYKERSSDGSSRRTPPGQRSHDDEDEVPGLSARPDLVAGPAWNLQTHRERRRDYLDFAATVWNAGPANLVVDGFRKRGEELMEAYQSFYENGKKVGTARTGTLIYDPRPGHEHWHFQDFAVYRLLDATGEHVVTSGKEAFCLAPTDAIDLTLPGAVLRPDSVGFGTACGSPNSVSIREVLQAGWGDTYYQSIPGQSFDITTIPNGTYIIEVVANFEGRLYEVTADNNVSRRTIEIGGTRGKRTVTAEPWNGLAI